MVPLLPHPAGSFFVAKLRQPHLTWQILTVAPQERPPSLWQLVPAQVYCMANQLRQRSDEQILDMRPYHAASISLEPVMVGSPTRAA